MVLLLQNFYQYFKVEAWLVSLASRLCTFYGQKFVSFTIFFRKSKNLRFGVMGQKNIRGRIIFFLTYGDSNDTFGISQ